MNCDKPPGQIVSQSRGVKSPRPRRLGVSKMLSRRCLIGMIHTNRQADPDLRLAGRRLCPTTAEGTARVLPQAKLML